MLRYLACLCQVIFDRPDTHNSNSYPLTTANKVPYIFAISFHVIQGPELSPWYRVLLEHLIVTQLVKDFSASI